jgi:uncharacterized membrane protein YkvA (DUF1232 family)
MVWFAIALGVMLLVWALVIAALLVMGRRADARLLAGFIPDCLIMMKRLIADPRLPRRRKLLLGCLVGYLALPFDLIPDFIPVAGQLDDVIVVGLVLRSLIRADGGEMVREHWPGPQRSLDLLLRATRV